MQLSGNRKISTVQKCICVGMSAPRRDEVLFNATLSLPHPDKSLPVQPVDATPSAINLFSKGGVYDASETGTAFRDAENRHVELLEGGAVVASDWTRLRQEPRVHSVYVVAARRDCSGRSSALAANAHTGRARGHLSGNCFRF